MSDIDTLVLDARPLSQVVHPRKFQDITAWFYSAVRAGYRIVIPEVIDYEVRRGLLRIPAPAQLDRLDRLVEGAHFDPITRPIMQDAAHVWAEARQMGRPFTSDDRLNGDAILIAHTRALGDLEQVIVITDNVRHLSPFVPAKQWTAFSI